MPDVISPTMTPSPNGRAGAVMPAEIEPYEVQDNDMPLSSWRADG